MGHSTEPHSQEMSALAPVDQLMQNRRFGEAIAGYRAQLVTDPQNLPVLLKLGICHLLNRSEQEFLRIYRKSGEIVAQSAELPGDIQTLWGKYQGLAARATAGALVFGSLAATGSLAAAPPTAADIKPAPAAEPAGATVTPPPPTPNQKDPYVFTGHKYSGGVFLPFDKADVLILPSDQRPPQQQEDPTGKDTSR